MQQRAPRAAVHYDPTRLGPVWSMGAVRQLRLRSSASGKRLLLALLPIHDVEIIPGTVNHCSVRYLFGARLIEMFGGCVAFA